MTVKMDEFESQLTMSFTLLEKLLPIELRWKILDLKSENGMTLLSSMMI